MSKILDGKSLSEKINWQTKNELKKLEGKPHLVAIQVGNNKESKLYINHKARAAKEIGIEFTHKVFNENISESDLFSAVQEINMDENVDAIMIQLPLPSHIKSNKIIQSIFPWKDVEGFHPLNQGLLNIGEADLASPTALGVMSLIDEYEINLEGKNIVIIGSGNIVGRPLSKIFINANATVTVCNKSTKNLNNHTKMADIIVSAAGSKNLINAKNVKKGTVIINVGITKNNDKIEGDINFDELKDIASFITPIVGGTGPLTVAHLLKNTLVCYKVNNKNGF